MRIRIDPEVADQVSAHRWLDRILAKVEDHWHVLDIRDVEEELAKSSWAQDAGQRGARIRELLQATATGPGAWGLEPHSRELRVRLHAKSKAELGPEDAARLAEEPLTLLVENRHSDGAFLRRVFHELDRPLSRWFRDSFAALRFDSVGGSGNIPKEVQDRCQTSVPGGPRLVVIADSDRDRPGAPHQTARKIKTTCKRYEIPCWILAKREAENYLPERLLRAYPDGGPNHSDTVDAWSELSEEQKDFFDMRKGPSKSSEANPLFVGIPEALEHGFGEGIGACWNNWQVQGVPAALSGRSRGDLEQGLALIRREV